MSNFLELLCISFFERAKDTTPAVHQIIFSLSRLFISKNELSFYTQIHSFKYYLPQIIYLLPSLRYFLKCNIDLHR